MQAVPVISLAVQEASMNTPRSYLTVDMEDGAYCSTICIRHLSDED